MDSSKVLYALVLIIFVAMAGLTFYTIATKIGNNDNAKTVGDAMTTVTYYNVGGTVALMILATLFTRANPEVRSSYTFLLAHLSLLVSITAVSIAAIVQFS